MKQYEKCCGAFLFSAAIPAIPLIALLCEKKRLEILAQRLAGMPIPVYLAGILSF